MPKDTTPPIFVDKTFANSDKTAKFTKVFSLESFPLYGICEEFEPVKYRVLQNLCNTQVQSVEVPAVFG